MVRSSGARLAVLLFAVISATTLRAAIADPGCVVTPSGIDCGYWGTSTSTAVTTLPPLRYLATGDDPQLGPCWYWSRYPPGLDAWDPANDAGIIFTRWELPECPSHPGSTTITVTSEAWDVFRSFSLERPAPALHPATGITNLPTLADLPRPQPLSHEEVLPDGRLLEVRADIETVWIDWGDGTPAAGYPAVAAFAGDASHAYTVKTCPEEYRLHDPSGWRCHPTLDRYPVRVTFGWVGRYRAGGSWTLLGTIERVTTLPYDVDEVVGVLVAP
ncbi:MAG: hypothetical protein A2Z12_08055 [Actinobacteria bacterium RBG_16_68_21]|nr:MAG: hypothetical protein A2Z12_08055 [Actinobacteria bacterium RBG_16_68_21]